MNDPNSCPVCGGQISIIQPYCKQCGFELHLLPVDAPEELKEMEKERIRFAAENWEHLQKRDKELEERVLQLGRDAKMMSDRLSDLEAERNIIESQRSGVSDELANVNKKLKETRDKLAEARRKEKESVENLRRVEQQLEEALNAKPSDVVAPSKPAQSIPKGSPQAHPASAKAVGKPIGDLALYVGANGGECVMRHDIYRGETVVEMPQGLNIGVVGSLVKIIEKDGVFKIHDLCGKVTKRNGEGLSMEGNQIFGDSVFRIGEMFMRFDLPEINWEEVF